MAIQEKRIYVALLSTVLAFTYYYTIVGEMFDVNYLPSEDVNSLIGKNILIFIGVSMGINMIAQVTLSLLNPNGFKDCQVTDERDKMIELKGMQVSFALFGAGFMGSMFLLMYDYSTLIVFNSLLLSFAIGDTVGNIVKIVTYSRGY